MLALNKKSAWRHSPYRCRFDAVPSGIQVCYSSAVLARFRSDFAPRQMGLGTPSGCDAAVHSTIRFPESLTPDHVVVKLDFSNAFNSIRSAYLSRLFYFTVLSFYFHKGALSKATL